MNSLKEYTEPKLRVEGNYLHTVINGVLSDSTAVHLNANGVPLGLFGSQIDAVCLLLMVDVS